MEKMIVVGCGEHFRSNLAPALRILENRGVVDVIATVDVDNVIVDTSAVFEHQVRHLMRRANQSLSILLKEFAQQNPIILLAHSNSWHTLDTVDLVSKGFRIILEKPYAINDSEIKILKTLYTTYPNQIAFAEYYLTMKAMPLLYAAGLLSYESFFSQSPDYLMSFSKLNSIENFCGILKVIGQPRMVYCDILEGEGLTGTFHHRGRDFFDRRYGGGVIMDLAIHALAPLIALERYIGFLPEIGAVSVQEAYCDIYLNHAKHHHKVPSRYIAESFAEIHFTTLASIPITLLIGKYVLPNANQRRLIIIGDEGEALLDMSNCTLMIGERDQCPSEILRTPKYSDSKYVPVLLTSISVLRGHSPYIFDPNKVAFSSQEFALAISNSIRPHTKDKLIYQASATPRQIYQSSPRKADYYGNSRQEKRITS